jgi:hypothetical protein
MSPRPGFLVRDAQWRDRSVFLSVSLSIVLPVWSATRCNRGFCHPHYDGRTSWLMPYRLSSALSISSNSPNSSGVQLSEGRRLAELFEGNPVPTSSRCKLGSVPNVPSFELFGNALKGRGPALLITVAGEDAWDVYSGGSGDSGGSGKIKIQILTLPLPLLPPVLPLGSSRALAD